MKRQSFISLPREFYQRDATSVARDLLGKRLMRRNRDGLTSGTIIETEAYLHQNDSACHAAFGMNRKNAAMFGSPGTAYVYVIHARFCFNIVTHDPGIPEAVLIRAIEPVRGVEKMRRRRQLERLKDIARGPARLCEAMAIDRSLNGYNLCKGSRLWVCDHESGESPAIIATPRIGVTSEHEKRLRFVYAEHPFASGPKKLNQARSIQSTEINSTKK